MSMFENRWWHGLMFMCWFGCSAVLQGDIINYGDRVGTNVEFISISESSSSIGPGIGQVPELFGAPIVLGNSLIFQPKLFEANKAGGGVSLVDGQLSFGLQAKSGWLISGISIQEFGDYTLATPFLGGQGFVASSLAAFLQTANQIDSQSVSLTDQSTTPFGKFGIPWGLDANLSVTPVGNGLFTMNNTLVAASLSSTDAAFIKKKGVVISVMTTPIPEPNFTGLFLWAAVLLATRIRLPR